VRFKDQVVLVTGAAAGIGFVTAQRFAAEGARLEICDVNPQSGEKAAAALGAGAAFKAVDVSDSGAVSEWVEEVLERHDRIDVLVNNAGITRDGLLMRMKEDDWDAVLGVNLKGAFICTKAVSKTLVRQRSGCIVNVASVVGVIGNPGQANYVASKAGLIGLTKTTARELASRGINVNAVAPGFIETEMTAALPEKAKTAMLAQIPLGRPGRPADVAGVVTFLASPEAAYLTGQVIHVSGGMYM
jgi:3-oxoacyl-[acyl-carrier protein] reductase